MSADLLTVFVAIIFVAGYFQTVTGFGLSMIAIGATAGLGLTSVATMAAIVNLLALVNCAIALVGRHQVIDRRILVAVTIGVVPAIFAGLFLLDYLSAEANSVLRVVLGAVIVYGGVSIVWQASQRAQRSSDASFVVAGVFGGLCGGMFGMSGPPLIYQLYRQPLALECIRSMLIVIFTITSSVRIVLLVATGRIDGHVLWLSLFAIPAIAIGTFVGRRLPPPLSTRSMRWLICIVLVTIGLELILTELL